jgi:putative transposase
MYGRDTARRVPPARRVPASTAEHFGKPVPGSLPTIIRSFKSAVTKRINEIRQTPGAPVWQKNYNEHIIKNELYLNRIRKYIIQNPANRQAYQKGL